MKAEGVDVVMEEEQYLQEILVEKQSRTDVLCAMYKLKFVCYNRNAFG